MARLVGPALPALHARLRPRDDARSRAGDRDGEPTYALAATSRSETDDAGARDREPGRLLRRGRRLDGLQQRPGRPGARLPDRGGPRADRLPGGRAPPGSTSTTPLKRAVFGWKSRQLVDIFFSDLINDEHPRALLPHADGAHQARRAVPVRGHRSLRRHEGRRAQLDDQRDDHRPRATRTACRSELGDKSDRRTPDPQPTRVGQLRARLGQGHASTPTPARSSLYKFADEPIIDTWADIYPGPVRGAGGDAGPAARAGPVPAAAHARPVRRRLHLLAT